MQLQHGVLSVGMEILTVSLGAYKEGSLQQGLELTRNRQGGGFKEGNTDGSDG